MNDKVDDFLTSTLLEPNTKEKPSFINEVLKDLKVEDLMTDLEQVVMIDINDPLSENLPLMIEKGFSRFPVYEDTIDHLIGVLHVRNLLPIFYEKQKIDTESFKSILYAPFFVSPTMRASSLLKSYQKRNQHMALVINEYGAFQGIITMEDVLEKLIGDINDEFDIDTEDIYFKIVNDGVLIVPELLISKFNQLFGSKLKPDDTEEFETMGGLILEKTGYLLNKGEHLIIDHFDFMIKDREGSKITEILVKDLNKKR